MENQVVKTFTITANESLMGKIERFLACLDFFTKWGHSSVLQLSQDGDGEDVCSVQGLDVGNYREYANWISDNYVGNNIESVDATLEHEQFKRYCEKRKRSNLV